MVHCDGSSCTNIHPPTNPDEFGQDCATKGKAKNMFGLPTGFMSGFNDLYDDKGKTKKDLREELRSIKDPYIAMRGFCGYMSKTGEKFELIIKKNRFQMDTTSPFNQGALYPIVLANYGTVLYLAVEEGSTHILVYEAGRWVAYNVLSFKHLKENEKSRKAEQKGGVGVSERLLVTDGNDFNYVFKCDKITCTHIPAPINGKSTDGSSCTEKSISDALLQLVHVDKDEVYKDGYTGFYDDRPKITFWWTATPKHDILKEIANTKKGAYIAFRGSCGFGGGKQDTWFDFTIKKNRFKKTFDTMKTEVPKGRDGTQEIDVKLYHIVIANYGNMMYLLANEHMTPHIAVLNDASDGWNWYNLISFKHLEMNVQSKKPMYAQAGGHRTLHKILESYL